jgi:hypothetical protein
MQSVSIALQVFFMGFVISLLIAVLIKVTLFTIRFVSGRMERKP